jgi:hypothetical protein
MFGKTYVYVYKILVEEGTMLRKSDACGMLCDGVDISVQAQQYKKQVPILTHNVTILPRLFNYHQNTLRFALGINCLFHFFCKLSSKTFFTKTNIWRATIEMHVENARRSACKVPAFVARFKSKFVSTKLSYTYQYQN